jgi:hypothetical protein
MSVSVVNFQLSSINNFVMEHSIDFMKANLMWFVNGETKLDGMTLDECFIREFAAQFGKWSIPSNS